jgi:hypothetical protein
MSTVLSIQMLKLDCFKRLLLECLAFKNAGDFCCCLFVCVLLGVELWALCLPLHQSSWSWLFLIGFCLCPAQLAQQSSNLCFPAHWYAVHHHAIGWDEVSQTFWQGLPWTRILPISASQVAKITGLSQHAWPQNKMQFVFLRLYSTTYKQWY